MLYSDAESCDGAEIQLLTMIASCFYLSDAGSIRWEKADLTHFYHLGHLHWNNDLESWNQDPRKIIDQAGLWRNITLWIQLLLLTFTTSLRNGFFEERSPDGNSKFNFEIAITNKILLPSGSFPCLLRFIVF